MLRFTHTFPDVQFIIATHSPLVVTNLRQNEENKVFQMERKGNEYAHAATGNLFIHDYEYTLYEVMQTEPRNFLLSALSERYIRLRHRQKMDAANEVLDQNSMSPLKFEVAICDFNCLTECGRLKFPSIKGRDTKKVLNL